MLSKFRRALTCLLWIALLGLGTAILFSKLGRIHWFFELFSHFPFQYALALIAVLLVALLSRLWRPAIAATLLLIPTLLALSYYLPAKPHSDTRHDLRLVSFNVLTSNHKHREVREYLAAKDADFILVMETDHVWLEALAPLASTHPHTVTESRADNFGMGLFSRHPIESHQFLTFAGTEVPCLFAVVSVNGRKVNIVGAHPLPPIGGRRAASRNAYLKALSELTSQSEHPTIVMGDFNSTIWSPFFRDFMKKSGLRDSGYKAGFQASWHRRLLPFAIPIDHILHCDQFICTDRTIGPNLGSDHRPVLAELAF